MATGLFWLYYVLLDSSYLFVYTPRGCLIGTWSSGQPSHQKEAHKFEPNIDIYKKN